MCLVKALFGEACELGEDRFERRGGMNPRLRKERVKLIGSKASPEGENELQKSAVLESNAHPIPVG